MNNYFANKTAKNQTETAATIATALNSDVHEVPGGDIDECVELPETIGIMFTTPPSAISIRVGRPSLSWTTVSDGEAPKSKQRDACKVLSKKSRLQIGAERATTNENAVGRAHQARIGRSSLCSLATEMSEITESNRTQQPMATRRAHRGWKCTPPLWAQAKPRATKYFLILC